MLDATWKCKIRYTHDSGSLAKLYTPSTWPGSKLARNGCANMRSNFVALRALVYSRARSKGCKLGSRLRVCLATFDPGACVDAADLLRALIFILSVEVLRSFAVAIRRGSSRNFGEGGRKHRGSAGPEKQASRRTSTFWHLTSSFYLRPTLN